MKVCRTRHLEAIAHRGRQHQRDVQELLETIQQLLIERADCWRTLELIATHGHHDDASLAATLLRQQKAPGWKGDNQCSPK